MSQSRLVRNSVVWIVTVPVAARIVRELRENVTEPAWAKSAVESLHLPFHWQVLFLGSLAFAVAVLVFDKMCPEIIRENGSYGDFTAAGRGPSHLSGYLKALCRGPVTVLKPPVVEVSTWRAGGVVLVPETRGHKMHFARCEGEVKPVYPSMVDYTAIPPIGEELTEQAAFWGVWDHAERYRQGWSRVAFGAYWVGVACFGLVFLQNLWWVCSVVFA